MNRFKRPDRPHPRVPRDHQVLPALLLLLACCTFSVATAQTVYRCGSSYSDTPCPNGRAVQADDPRTEEQRSAAREGLARDKTLAREMEATRRSDEAHALALDKAALARAAAAHRQEDKKLKKPPPGGKKAGAGKTRNAKAPDPEFFTATDGATSDKKKTGGSKTGSKKKSGSKTADS